MGHIAEHIALQLETEAGHYQSRGKTRASRATRAATNVIYGYIDEQVGLTAGRLAVPIVNDLVQHEEGFDFHEALDEFIRIASGPRSGRRPQRSSRRRSAATFPGSGSTVRRSSSSARGSTSSASARR
jgi:hypothetical protein